MRLAFKNPEAVKELFAALASAEHDDVATLSKPDRASLEMRIEEATDLTVYDPKEFGSISVVLVKKPEVNPAKLLKTLLPKVNYHLRCLLQCEYVRLPTSNASILTYINKPYEVLVEVWETQTVEQMLTEEFLRLLREQPFPYRKCPQCDAVFTRYRQQKFCGPACTYTATQHRRGDAKREAMRIYMREKRARERGKA